MRKQLIEHLFRQNYIEMLRLANIMLGNDGEAEDVVQDVFLRLAESDIAFLADQRSLPSPRSNGYLLTAVRNACLNKIRQTELHNRVKRLLPVDDVADLQPIDKQRERLDEIATFVDQQMEEPHRSIFHLRFDDDLTIAAIARRLHLNPNTTYKYLAQSIQQIRNHFMH